jgi:hypothetical protein
MLITAGITLFAIISVRHDRLSLHWPTVPGVMLQADVAYGSRPGHSYVKATYTYNVNGTRYVSHQISLWSPDLERVGGAESFAKAHPPNSSVNVYYDPQQPDNAVLIADELFGKIAPWSFGIVFVLSTWLIVRNRKEYAQLVVQCREEAAEKSRKAPAREIKPLKSDISSKSFLSYEPAARKCKLNCFPDKECLLEVLGHKGKKLQDWEPDDRVVDASGRVYRLVYRPDNKWYDIEPAGETWDYAKLLELAIEDAQCIGKDTKDMRDRVDLAPEAEKITAIMQYVDALPSTRVGPWIVAILFLLLFFLTVFFGAGYLFTWLKK